MKMLKQIFCLVVLTLCAWAQPVFSADEFLMSEKSLIEALEDSPNYKSIRSKLLQTKAKYDQSKDPYDYNLTGSASLGESQERTLIDFAPAVREKSTRSIGITRPTRYGVQLGLNYANTTTATALDGAVFGNNSTSTLSFRLTIDLFRNFLGRFSDSDIQANQYAFEAAQIQEKLDKKNLQIQLRTLFWDYIAAEESLIIAERMLKKTREQIKVVKRQKRSEVADRSDVARFYSQESERTSQVLQYETVKKQLESEIKNLFPRLASKKFVLDKYSVDDTVQSFYQCINKIESKKETPLEYTLYDEIIELKQKQYAEERKKIETYSDVDVQLESEYGYIGNGFGRVQANDNLTEDQRPYYSIGVSVSVPLGGKKQESEKTQLVLNQTALEAETENIKAQLDSYHYTVVDAIGLLRRIIENRIENDGQLQLVLQDANKKYKQARISTQDLLREEDSYLLNALSTISTEVEIIKVMFQYFALFTETPCQLNNV